MRTETCAAARCHQSGAGMAAYVLKLAVVVGLWRHLARFVIYVVGNTVDRLNRRGVAQPVQN